MKFNDIKRDLIVNYMLVREDSTLDELEEYIIGRIESLNNRNSRIATKAKERYKRDLEYIRSLNE